MPAYLGSRRLNKGSNLELHLMGEENGILPSIRLWMIVHPLSQNTWKGLGDCLGWMVKTPGVWSLS